MKKSLFLSPATICVLSILFFCPSCIITDKILHRKENEKITNENKPIAVEKKPTIFPPEPAKAEPAKPEPAKTKIKTKPKNASEDLGSFPPK
jgi:hypothetical protein